MEGDQIEIVDDDLVAEPSKALSAEEELIVINRKLAIVTRKIKQLERERKDLERRATQLKEEKQREECDKLLGQDWGSKKFEWSERLNLARKEIFGLDSYRPDQLAVMNASMSGHDCILIMPTGGGKSLTYQLPAVISEGVTLVVSPLLSLMEDQLMALKRLGIKAAMLTGSSDGETKKNVMKDMLDPASDMKLLYVTPEKCSKSKQFMAKLQKMHQAGRFTRLAIDEVHCCSQWGHDFRPDYKFLGAMRAMFSDVPILGLTATSTAAVTKDVKDILRIPQAMVFMAGFNRPNLHYSVRLKPDVAVDNYDYLANLVNEEFKGCSGIIYTTTVKEVETLHAELKARGARSGPYHAQMEAEARSRVHRMWAAGDIKVVVATVAFGMGIDKPDVRFVIHNTISRSMENFYQESGRAGRDNKPATCIMLWRLGDVFKQSPMVFTEKTGCEKLYNMVGYCLNTDTCRRNIIAEHFLESWEVVDCNKMCDNCEKEEGNKVPTVDVTDYAEAAVGILTAAGPKEIRVTALKLVDALQGRGANNTKLAGWKGGKLTKDQVEQVVAWLLVEGYLQEDMHYTPYSVISYLLAGHRIVKQVSVKFLNNKSTGAKSKQVTSMEKSKKPKQKKRKIESSSESSDEEPDFGSVKNGKKKTEADFELGDIVISSDDDFM
eukprot:GFUD01028582.1.p1 GENE.GFUD01028582.1~~GFUD01028582.1.p1  ORF type:complete len:664 (+),score=201.59 GFUD01028582.1:102-2093(+)